ncbi:DUF2398 family protein [Streptomyces lunaelactis]|uniref:DUF2398 family protein n=1 Tax=Streptomyces lunaelactis TaxID=1535768 RepID=UPI001584FEE0|nr:DUF2398 family protein [Streptomyces lunaelactis]NUK32291.1 DUF2398 family protein [Streptomyces lunaelactis]NUK41185.1 DUF2398 family protein [Streptomyces lunaelactis]
MRALTVTKRLEEQSAFIGLLTQPLVTPTNDAKLHRLALRHQRQLTEWFRRLGYRLVVAGQVVRLHRTPHAGIVTTPYISRPPKGRELVLTLVAAAACEESDSTTTLQAISDHVRMITGVETSPVTAYDPEYGPERSILLLAVRRLEAHGVLVRRTRDEEMLKAWEANRTGIGAGYDIDRAALLQLLDPHTAALAAPPTGSDETQLLAATRWTRMLRILIETPALMYADLSEDDATYARAVAGRLAEAARTMTGGTVEVRAEGLVLILPPDHPWAGDATLDWPKTAAPAWIALMLCDAAGATGERTDTGAVLLLSHQVDALAATLHTQHYTELTDTFRQRPEQIRPTAEATLRDAGLLEIDSSGNWTLKPAAARYRDPAPSSCWYTHTLASEASE